MAFSFSNSSIENLKNQVNIVDVIGNAVPLKKAGANYKGCCPFHNEKTPSFVVSEQKQIFTCFGCGASGDVIEFVKRYYNLDFGEAVDKLANQYGIKMEKRQRDDSRNIYYDVNKMAANFFYKSFTERANKGYPYMKRRGISPAILKKFGIGYADEQWDSLYKYMTSKGVDKKILIELGLVSESKGKCYDKFRNRVIFPIINTSGKVIGFGGRAISPDDNPKYLNSPESPVFQKKNNLYGLNISKQSVRENDSIILVEGYMDVISLYQSGVTNIGASLGTALTENQAALIKRYTKNVILSYDADGAGRKAALRGIDILRHGGCKSKVLHVTDGKDPDEYVKKKGKEAFMALVDKALPYAEYKLEAAKAGYNLNVDEDKIDYLKKATSIISELSPVEQEIYIKYLANDVKIPESAVRLELKGIDNIKPIPEYRKDQNNQSDEGNQEENPELTALEKTILKLITLDDTYIDKVNKLPGIMESTFGKKLYDMLIEEYVNNKSLDFNNINEKLSDKEAKAFDEVLTEVIVGGKEEQIFDDCVKAYENTILQKEENRLLTLLSIADEEDNKENISTLTEKLMEVQNKRRKNQGVTK